MNYEPYAPIGEFPLPPGVSLPVGFPQIGDIAKQLGLPDMGVYTPWGARESGVNWDPVSQPPDTNIAIFGINDAALSAAQTLAFNQPIPFVGFLTASATAPDAIAQALKGTPYKFYQTQAVYKQADTAPTPRIYFLHWCEHRQPGDAEAGNASLSQAAQQLGGTFVYAIQVNYGTSATRQPPAVPFQSALAAQIGAESPPAPPPPPNPPPPPPPTKASMVGPVLVGTGVALVTFFAVRELQKRG